MHSRRVRTVSGRAMDGQHVADWLFRTHAKSAQRARSAHKIIISPRARSKLLLIAGLLSADEREAILSTGSRRAGCFGRAVGGARENNKIAKTQLRGL